MPDFDRFAAKLEKSPVTDRNAGPMCSSWSNILMIMSFFQVYLWVFNRSVCSNYLHKFKSLFNIYLLPKTCYKFTFSNNKRNSQKYGSDPIDAFAPSLPKFFKLDIQMAPACEKAYPLYLGPLCIIKFPGLFTSEVKHKLKLNTSERNHLSK